MPAAEPARAIRSRTRGWLEMSFGGSVLAAAGDLKGPTELWTAGVSDTERLLAKNENPYSHVGLGVLYAKQGRKQQALRHLHELSVSDPGHPLFLFFAAQIRALVGDREHSLETLKRAVENGFLNLPMLEYLSRPMMAFHSLRDDPEFDAIRADLARRIGELRARY